jgi:hypothetical protein
MSGDLLAGVEAAAGLAVYGGSPAAVRDELVAAGIPGLLASKDPTLWGTAAEARAKSRLGWVDAYRRSRELLPQLAELCEELADLTSVVVCRPAAAANAITRSLGVPLWQGYCVVGLVLVTASMRSCGRRLARRVARAMLDSPLPRWYPLAVLRSVANTAGPLPVRA